MKALIVEDEPHAVSRLKKYVNAVDPSMEWLGSLDSIDAVLDWFSNNAPPDVVFMDVHLADGNCFDIFEQMDIPCPVIFTTAYDEYALKAFEQHSIDYVLKPIKKKDVERALDKLTKYFKSSIEEAAATAAWTDSFTASNDLKRLLVKVGPRINLIKIEDVAYFYSKDKITFAITRQERRFPIDKSLEFLEQVLDKKVFFRINRQFIIDVDAIDSMLSHTKGRVKIELQPPINIETIVSTERSPRFKKWLVS